MILRCTAKLQAVVGRPDPRAGSMPASAGDWYANLLWIDRRKCLLVTHAGTLFSVFAPDVRVGELRPIGSFVVPRIIGAIVKTWSGGRGESHPPAPTERSVAVSRHFALLIQPARTRSSPASAQTAWGLAW